MAATDARAAYYDRNMPHTEVGSDALRKLMVPATYAGDPTNNLTPEFIGQYCHDTSNGALYWASTAASSGWKKLTP